MASNRRTFIQTMGLAGLGATATITTFSCSKTEKNVQEVDDGQQLFIGDNIALVNTEYGKVRGYISKGIFTFLGIPYGADTSGKNRFMPPEKPTPWNNTFAATWWGSSSPQIMEGRYSNSYSSFLDHWNYYDVSEDCLKLNIWTPSINDNKKRPVIVWLHGGGFFAGNSIEQDGYHGENLSRLGDVVFCSINHRLNTFGFSDFSGIGNEKYSFSGNVGMLDIIAALEWIKNNISNFGGDYGNVTIMGQSGGGGKVSTIMVMPKAKGLFHKAVSLSGPTLRIADKEMSQKLGAYVLKEAGLSNSQIGKLQELEWQEYLRIASKANQKILDEYKQKGYKDRVGWSPVVDGKIIPNHPFDPSAPEQMNDIPMIISTTFNENSPSKFDSALENISFEEVKEKIKSEYKDKADQIVNAFRKNFPGNTPIEIWSMITSNRKNAVALANVKSKQNAPVYLAWFGWQPPLFDNRLRAFHCLDICFWFYNTDRMLSHTGGGLRPRNLSLKMAQSLISFAYTGSPNNGGLPTWPRYSESKGETMVLDDKPTVEYDPDKEARNSIFQ